MAATRRKINKKVTKSICLSERYWEILKSLGEASQMSNGDIVRDCIIAMQFLEGYLGRGPNYTLDYGDFVNEFWEYFDKAKQIDEQVLFERPEEFIGSNGKVLQTSIYKDSFPAHPSISKEGALNE